MGLATYRATGVVVSTLKNLLGIRLRATGTENLVMRPTMFVPNHFTRIETFLIPYVIYRHARRQVRSLGTHSVFKGAFGRYFEALGGMSTRDPRRNRTIIRELMTHSYDWVIYPEGGLIKNKKTVHRGRFQLSHPERHGPPHTGAAMLALKAELSKRRYLQACAEQDRRRIEYYEETYGLTGCQEICPSGIVMVPVTLSFYPMRPSRNLINRIAKFLVHDLDPRLDEELTVEGAMLLKGTEVCVHFGRPVEVGAYLGRMRDLARRIAAMFSEANRAEMFLRQQARRLTDVCMKTIYASLEVNLDHLFCYGLRALEADRIGVDDLQAALYLAARELSSRHEVRLHPTVADGAEGLVTEDRYEPWECTMQLALREGVVRREDDELVLDRDALQADHSFHAIRLEKMTQVLANELEPVKPAVALVRRYVNLPPQELRRLASQRLHEREVEVFERDYEEVFDPIESKPRPLGEPYLLPGSHDVGVVLVHGYLASPEQMRPLAAYLNSRGLTVYAVRLPGHGTAPEQLTKVRWPEWLDAVLRGRTLVRRHCKRVVLGGFSLGGALALLAAAQPETGLAGVFSVNAPLRLRDRRASLVGPLVRWDGAMRQLRLRRDHFRIANDQSESPEINYGFDYLRSIRELRRTTDACRRALGRVTASALVIQAEHDPVVAHESGRLILARLGSDDKILSLMPFDRHLIVRGMGSDAVFETIGRFIERATEPPSEAPPEEAPAPDDGREALRT